MWACEETVAHFLFLRPRWIYSRQPLRQGMERVLAGWESPDPELLSGSVEILIVVFLKRFVF
jgi:hypothetical protein